MFSWSDFYYQNFVYFTFFTSWPLSCFKAFGENEVWYKEMSSYVFTYVKGYKSLIENSIRFSMHPSMENTFNRRWKCLIKNRMYESRIYLKGHYQRRVLVQNLNLKW